MKDKQTHSDGLSAIPKGQLNTLLRSFFADSLEFFTISSPEGYFLETNKSFENHLGFSKEHLHSIPFLDLIHPEDVASTLVEVEKLNLGGVTINFKNRYKKADGNYCWIEWKSNQDPDSGLIFSSCRDVSVEMQNQEDIRKWHYLFHNSNLALVIAGVDGTFIDVSPAFCRLTGYNKEDLVKNHISLVVSPEGEQAVEETGKKIHTEEFVKTEIDMLRKNGTRFEAKITSSLVKDDKGNPVVRFAHIEDITRINAYTQQIEEQNLELIQVNQALDSFVYKSSHDLKAPVLNTLGLIDLLKSRIPEEDTMSHEVMGMIKKECNKFKATINGFLSLANIDMEMSPTWEILPLKDTFDEVLEDYTREIKQARAELVWDLSATQEIVFPKAYFLSIFSNLLSNSLKYKSPDRKPIIEIEVHNQEKHWRFRFKDNGIGIDLEAHGDKLFQFLARIHENPDVAGVGIGLHNVKKILMKCRGEISVNSEPGKYTEFNILIPKNEH